MLINFLTLGRNTKNIFVPNIDYVVNFTPKLLKKMEYDRVFRGFRIWENNNTDK